MKNINREKGSVLIMSVILLAVVTMIGSMIVLVFFKGYVDVALDIRGYKDTLDVQVEVQNNLVNYSKADFEELLLNAEELPLGFSYNDLDNTYLYSFSNDLYEINVILDADLFIKKWNVKEK